MMLGLKARVVCVHTVVVALIATQFVLTFGNVDIKFEKATSTPATGFLTTLDVSKVDCTTPFSASTLKWMQYLNPSALRVIVPPSNDWTQLVGDLFGKDVNGKNVATQKQWESAVSKLRKGLESPGEASILRWMHKEDDSGPWNDLDIYLTGGQDIMMDEVSISFQSAFASSAGLIGLDPNSDAVSKLTYETGSSFVLTWYSLQDKAPERAVKSTISGNILVPFVSVALPYRFMKRWGGSLEFGETLYVSFLDGRKMPDSTRHTGWVRIDDVCGDEDDDSKCFKEGINGTEGGIFPTIDLYVGDVFQSGMVGNHDGPAGNNMEIVDLMIGGDKKVQLDFSGRVSPEKMNDESEDNSSSNVEKEDTMETLKMDDSDILSGETDNDVENDNSSTTKRRKILSDVDSKLYRKISYAQRLLLADSEAQEKDQCPGVPLDVILTLYKEGLSIIGLWNVGCGSIISTEDASKDSYWAERWELYRSFYVAGRFFAHLEIPQLELLASLDDCPSEELMKDEISIRSAALQHAYSDHAVWMGPTGVVAPSIIAPNLPSKTMEEIKQIEFPNGKNENWNNFGEVSASPLTTEEACASIENVDSAETAACIADKLLTSLKKTGWISLGETIPVSAEANSPINALLVSNSDMKDTESNSTRIVGSTKSLEAARLLLTHAAGTQQSITFDETSLPEQFSVSIVGDSMAYYVYSINSGSTSQDLNLDFSEVQDVEPTAPAIISAIDEDYHGEVIFKGRTISSKLSVLQSPSSVYVTTIPRVPVRMIEARKTTKEAVLYATEPEKEATTRGGLIVRLSRTPSSNSVVLLDFSSATYDPAFLVTGILEMSIVSVPMDAPRKLTVVALEDNWSTSNVGWNTFGDILQSPNNQTGWGADYVNWANAVVVGHLTAFKQGQRIGLDVTDFLRRGKTPSFLILQTSRPGEDFAGPIQIATSRAPKSKTPRLRLYHKQSTKTNDSSLATPTEVTTLAPGKPLPLPFEGEKGSVWNIAYYFIGKNSAVEESNDGLMIKYPKGGYGGKDSVSFRANPYGLLPARSCVMSFSVYVPLNHSFVKGGKMHGVCIGEKPEDCATGKQWSPTKGSVRIVWGDGGKLGAYLYIPAKDPQSALDNLGEHADEARVTAAAGIGLWRKSGDLKVNPGEWNSVSLSVDVGSPAPVADGIITMTINGETKTAKGLSLRPSSSVLLSSYKFSTFYGGSDENYAPSEDQYLTFKDFRFSASGV